MPLPDDRDTFEAAIRAAVTAVLPSATVDIAVVILFCLDSESSYPYVGIMKTTVEIPDAELRDLVRFTHARTKRQAIVTAISDFNRRRRMAALIKHSGTFRSLPTNEEIEALEEQEPHGRGAR